MYFHFILVYTFFFFGNMFYSCVRRSFFIHINCILHTEFSNMFSLIYTPTRSTLSKYSSCIGRCTIYLENINIFVSISKDIKKRKSFSILHPYMLSSIRKIGIIVNVNVGVVVLIHKSICKATIYVFFLLFVSRLVSG